MPVRWLIMKRRLLLVPIALAALVGTGLGLDWWIAVPEDRTASYVGREQCVSCHQKESKDWNASDHDLAMDLATPEFVLGDFDDTSLQHHGVTSKMSRRGDEYFVHTEGPDGKAAEFKVKYVFGYEPLQQYLAELEGGQVQVLPVTWDTEEKRWFYASPDAPHGPDDVLHWTGSAQNWNHMCADCHTTDFKKNFDLDEKTHHYSFSEMDVSCEACHGPGSIHVELANSKSLFWDRRVGYGLAKLKDKNPRAQLETCAPCHAHRRHIYPDFQPGDEFLDHFSLSLLEDHLYHADGQIDEEVYVYGSFLQSKMYRKGVRCTNCHDPHTTRIKFEDNRLCTQCHLETKYDVPAHHHHKVDSTGAACVECHMPSKTYMVVDPRRDHSIRIPRPDLTVKLGTPNACNNCHIKDDETPEWAADAVVKWYGPERSQDPHYGETFAAARQGDFGAIEQLADLTRERDVGPIVRATAAALLGTRYPLARVKKHIERALRSRDALVRAAALRTFDGRPVSSREEAERFVETIAPKLGDKSRLVRLEAARILAQLPRTSLTSAQRRAFEKNLKDYETGLHAHSDQSGSHMNLGILYSNLGKADMAIGEFRTAIDLEPSVAGPRSNLVQLLEQAGDNDEVKQLRTQEAELLRRDASLLPENAPIHYRLALVEYLLGNLDVARTTLERACELDPRSTDYRMMLALLCEKQKRWGEALRSARQLTEMDPQNPQFRQLYENFQRSARQLQGPAPQE